MAFSFGGTSTPQASPPAFNFAGASSAPAFGATTTPAFGAAPTPGFGAAAPASSPFGVMSTPAFSFSQAPSHFGAPAGTPAYGTPGGTPSLFGGPAASPYGAPSPVQQAAAQLATKDNRPLSHSTKWDDLSPQAQQYLLELEKRISACREECRQLDGEERLAQAAGHRAGLEDETRALSQNVATLDARVRADQEQAEAVRDDVLHLMRHTEAALHTYKRTHAWREAARAGAGQALPPHVAEQLGGPVALPSQYLVDTVEGLGRRLRAHQVRAAELETALRPDGGSRAKASGADPAAVLQSLQGAMSNLHDCLMRTAAQIQALDDRVGRAKSGALSELARAGKYSDPFAEAERQERAQREARTKHSPMQGVATQAPPAGAVAPAPGAFSTPQQLSPPTGLFGTASPQNGVPTAAPTARKKTSRR